MRLLDYIEYTFRRRYFLVKRFIPVIAVMLLIFSPMVYAGSSPVGKWKTIDDKTNREASIIEVYEENGKYFGKISQTLLPEDKGKVCIKCSGSDKNKPLEGLVVMRNLTWDGSQYSNGTIMDPKDGKTYKCKIEVLENGKKLKVRGYLGISLIGRNQIWHRQ